MTPTKHSSHSQKWESSKMDKEAKGYGKEGSKKEESMDRKQMMPAKHRK